MNRLSLLAYKMLLALAVFSGVYFSGLVLHLNGIIIVLFALLGVAATILLPAFKIQSTGFVDQEKFSKPVQYAFAISLLLLSTAAFLLSYKWGSWDTASIWNLAARALSNPEHWRDMFEYDLGSHTDYPLFLPAVNALFIRFLPPAFLHVVPVFFAALSTILIPLWIFSRLAPKHIGVGIGVLLLFITNTYYLHIGMMQGADV